MADCEKIVAHIRREEIQEAWLLLDQNTEFRKIAKMVRQRYSALATLLDWEDLFQETNIRFIGSVQQGSDPTRNPGGFYYTICRNVCNEYTRKGYAVTDEMPVSWVKALADRIKMFDERSTRAKLDDYLRQLKPRWARLLTAYYLDEPPIEDHEELAAMLNSIREPGEKDVSAGSITVLLYRCRRKLEDLIGDKLPDILSD